VVLGVDHEKGHVFSASLQFLLKHIGLGPVRMGQSPAALFEKNCRLPELSFFGSRNGFHSRTPGIPSLNHQLKDPLLRFTYH
jgi:hypothetical protein